MNNLKKITACVLIICTVFLSGCENGKLVPDKDGLVVFDQSYIKVQKPLDEKSVNRFSDKINTICETYLQDSENIFYSIVPDKSYFIRDFLAEPLDYAKMQEMLQQGIKTAKYIDIFDCLNLADYYKSDIHWRQEKLQLVCDRLGEALGFKLNLSTFVHNSVPDYLGHYQDKEGVQSEELFYLSNKMTTNAVVENMQTPTETTTYSTARLATKIAYDVFLAGATPIQVIDNPNAVNQKELIIFRDSFASSLAPLLIGEYKKITLIDIRYITTDLLSEHIDFNGQDVLFLYNTEIINKSVMLK